MRNIKGGKQTKKKLIGIIICILLIGTALSSVSGSELKQYTSISTLNNINPSLNKLNDSPFNRTLYLPHRPIYINGNDNFTFLNGVTSGSGTKNNPYIIKGWAIKSNFFEAGITIQDVDAYFVIKNCLIYNIVKRGIGILFINVAKGIIEKNTITGNRIGIGFSPYEGPDGSCYNIIQNNSITSNGEGGIVFGHIGYTLHSYNIITHNDISNNIFGISMITSAFNQITYNNITSNYGVGIDFFVRQFGGEYNRVHHNNFIDNYNQASEYYEQKLMNYWDDGYPSGGNYWSDYTGEDIFSGPNQSIPGSDGIGDIPYLIPALPGLENYDFYPFMEPLDIEINVSNFGEIENIINSFTNENNNVVLQQRTHNSWWFLQFLQNHLRMFPILRQLLGV